MYLMLCQKYVTYNKSWQNSFTILFSHVKLHEIQLSIHIIIIADNFVCILFVLLQRCFSFDDL